MTYQQQILTMQYPAGEDAAAVEKAAEIAAEADAEIEQLKNAAATTWQPIETAPKNGRTLLLGYYNQCNKWRTVRGQWFSQEQIDDEWEEAEGATPGWFETSAEADDVPSCWAITPSHWMTLPRAPQNLQKGN